MGNGVPVRLSESLTVRARTAAAVLDRSLTEQVEHWARLGQAVEAAISAATLHALKARSHDADLAARLAVADTPAGRAAAAALIRARQPRTPDASDPAIRIAAAPTASRKRPRRKKSR